MTGIFLKEIILFLRALVKKVDHLQGIYDQRSQFQGFQGRLVKLLFRWDFHFASLTTKKNIRRERQLKTSYVWTFT